MSRLVEAKPKADAGFADLSSADKSTEEKVKDWGERVAKYVPAEVLAFYTGALQLILTKSGSENASFRLWATGIFGLIAWATVPLWLGRFSSDARVKRTNQIVGSIAFGAWAYAYPAGWFTEMGWHEPVIAGLLILTVSFASGFIQPKA
jgi:hypothetical protein